MRIYDFKHPLHSLTIAMSPYQLQIRHHAGAETRRKSKAREDLSEQETNFMTGYSLCVHIRYQTKLDAGTEARRKSKAREDLSEQETTS